MRPQYGELRLTSDWDRFGSLGHPSKFQRVSRLAFFTAATSFTGGQPNFARCLDVSWAGTLYIHFRGLADWRNFATCNIYFASKSCVLLYWQRYYTALHQRGQPNFPAWYKEWNYGTFAEGATYIARAAITLALAHILVSYASTVFFVA